MVSEQVSISVVIPCFNDGAFLKEALESVLAQTLQPIETLIIDDGSTDPKTIKLLQNLDTPRVKVIHQDNRGLSGARNTGMQHARGKYVYLLDADNVIYPQCLSKLAQLMQGNDNAIAATSRIRFMGGPLDGTEWCEPYNPYLLLVNNQWDAGIMLRKESVEKYNLWYDESMRYGYEDWEFNIRLAKTGKSILFHPEPLYQYRIRGNSLLNTSRKHHAEILRYIRSRHSDLYAPENLLTVKRSYVPALLIYCFPQERAKLQRFLKDQTFRDWVFDMDTSGDDKQKIRYQFFHAGIDALMRLPTEALEGAIIALECNPRFQHCVVSIKEKEISWWASSGTTNGSLHAGQSVAVIRRQVGKSTEADIPEILSNCELLVEFPDQRPGSECGWSPALLQFKNETILNQKDIVALRKQLSLLGRRFIGPKLHRECVRLYDYVYGTLVSERGSALRQKVRNYLGEQVEQIMSKALYGFFLMKAPTEKEITSWRARTSFPEGPPPLFLSAPEGDKINVLVATAWLNQGGVEQYILNLCRRLDHSRFRIIIATTKPSAHPWDNVVRKAGVKVFHLADLLGSTGTPRGFAHLVLNYHIHCLHIVHSREAYEAARNLKHISPWLSISDRLEVLEKGGFPQASVKIGADSIDVRTVSHRKLAEHMYKNYHLQEGSLRVVYAGTDIKRINEALTRKNGLLHKMCSLPPDTPIVIFVGRLTYQKRPEVFVRSVATILDIKPDCKAHFAMMGDGELKESVQNLIFHYKLGGSIHLLGTHPNAVDLMADATLLMMPSAYEGLALVSYEAMALGVPQIFANVNGQSELITPETGILIDNGPGEEARYAHACLELLSDTARRARMAAAGKQRIRSYFSAENAVREYSQIFEELAELSRKRGSEIPSLRPPHIDPLHALS